MSSKLLLFFQLAVITVSFQGTNTTPDRDSTTGEEASQEIITTLKRIKEQGTVSFDDGESLMANIKTLIDNMTPDQRKTVLQAIDKALMVGNPRGTVSNIIHEFLVQAVQHSGSNAELLAFWKDASQKITNERNKSIPQPSFLQKATSFVLAPFTSAFNGFNSVLKEFGSQLSRTEEESRELKPYSEYNYRLPPVFTTQIVANDNKGGGENEGGGGGGGGGGEMSNKTRDDVNMLLKGIADISKFKNLTDSEITTAVSNLVSGISSIVSSLTNEINGNKTSESITVMFDSLEQESNKIGNAVLNLTRMVRENAKKNLTDDEISNFWNEEAPNLKNIVKNIATESVTLNYTKPANASILTGIDNMADSFAQAVTAIFNLVVFPRYKETVNNNRVFHIDNALQIVQDLAVNIAEIFVPNPSTKNKTKETLKSVFKGARNVVDLTMTPSNQNGKIGAANNTISVIQSVLETLRSLLNIWSSSNSTLPSSGQNVSDH